MARPAGRHAATDDAERAAAEAAEALRDQLTREWLEVAVSDRHVDVLGYEPHWWGGQAYERCLVVKAGRDRLRVVESGGQAVVLPFRRRAAGRVLGQQRRPVTGELTVPPGRSTAPMLVCIDADDDVRRCSAASCGALLPVDATGNCPRCGHWSNGHLA
jgi:hypothetical protein